MQAGALQWLKRSARSAHRPAAPAASTSKASHELRAVLLLRWMAGDTVRFLVCFSVRFVVLDRGSDLSRLLIIIEGRMRQIKRTICRLYRNPGDRDLLTRFHGRTWVSPRFDEPNTNCFCRIVTTAPAGFPKSTEHWNPDALQPCLCHPLTTPIPPPPPARAAAL